MCLVIEFNDGSNPFSVIRVSSQVIGENIAWQQKQNGNLIQSIYVLEDDEIEKH